MDEYLYSISDFIRRWRSGFFFLLALVSFFILGFLDRQFRENEFSAKTQAIAPYLNQKIELEGEVSTYPIPAEKKYSYVLNTTRIRVGEEWMDLQFRIQLNSVTYQSPEKGDFVRVQTKLYVPQFLELNRKIKHIDAYGTVFGDRRFEVLSKAELITTKMRDHIFEKAQANLTSQNYGYFRAMVFGDQAMLGQFAIERLKETGLLHLFVVSGSHILFACAVGFWLLRITLSWFPVFHQRKRFFLWIKVGAVLFVLLFLELINPPISSFRAVGTMFLFIALSWMKRPQHPLWNLGVIFFATVLYNPIYLFDISTQLTFASVTGILCFGHLLNEKTKNMELSKSTFGLLRAGTATLGAGLFTIPVLYFQFGTFYPFSLLYNLILTPTLGALVSGLSVASLVWTFIPFDFLNKIGFSVLDFLFETFEKVLFWRSPFEGMSIGNPVLSSVSGLYVIWGVGICGTAFIITQHFLKKRSF